MLILLPTCAIFNSGKKEITNHQPRTIERCHPPSFNSQQIERIKVNIWAPTKRVGIFRPTDSTLSEFFYLQRERLPATKRRKVIVDWFSMSNSEEVPFIWFLGLLSFLSVRPSSLLCVYATTYAKYNRIFSHINALLFSFAELWSVTDDSERRKFSIFSLFTCTTYSHKKLNLNNHEGGRGWWGKIHNKIKLKFKRI